MKLTAPVRVRWLTISAGVVGLVVLSLGLFGKILFLRLILPTNIDLLEPPQLACATRGWPAGLPSSPNQTIHIFTVGQNQLTTVETGKPAAWVPIQAYVIERGTDLVVIDPGPDRRRIGNDLDYNGLINHWVNPIRLATGEDLPSQMAAAGLNPAQATMVILTHGHSDHTGNLDRFPKATVVMSAKDKQDVLARGSRAGGKPEELAAVTTWRQIDFATAAPVATFAHGVDLFGDQSLYLVETDGHTAGQLSVLASTRDRTLLVAGDAVALSADLADHYAMPGQHDRARFLYHLAEIDCLRATDDQLVIFPGHDQPIGPTGNDPALIQHPPVERIQMR